MTEKNIQIEVQCPSCEGTGLYKGFAEGEGCAVVCSVCKGTGKSSYFYHPFTGRKGRKGIKRVFRSSCGYGSTAKGEGGCTYEEWKAGQRPAPVKEVYCPYLWTDQSMQNSTHKAHKMYKSFCDRVLHGSGSISNCPLYKSKEKCWEEFEKTAKDWD